MIRYRDEQKDMRDLFIRESKPEEYLFMRWVQLEELVDLMDPEIQFKELKNNIIQKVNDKKLSSDWICEQAELIKNQTKAKEENYDLINYMACLVLAQHELDLGEMDRMWINLAAGEFHHGRISFMGKYKQSGDDSPQTLAHLGGIGKAAKPKKAKEHALYLVESSKNGANWQSENDAIKDILEDFTQYCKTENIGLRLDLLRTRLKAWLRDDTDFKKRFVQAMRNK